MKRLSLITIAGASDLEEQVATELASAVDVELFMRCVDRVEVLAAIRSAEVDAIVCFDGPAWFDRQCIEEAAERGIAVVMVTDDPLVALTSEQRGVPVLPAGISVDQLVSDLKASPGQLSIMKETESDPTRGKLIAVWGAKGSPGRTTIAIELAFELAALEPSTLLLDGDPYGGDVLQLLGMTEELPTVVWASRLAHRDEISPAVFASQLRRAGRLGPVVLPGLPRSRAWSEVSPFGWKRLLQGVTGTFVTTVVDTGFSLEDDETALDGPGRGRNEMARTVVEEADHVVAVCGADPGGLKHFIRSFEDLEALTDPDSITVVVNRAAPGDRRAISALLSTHLGKRVAHFVPDRPADAARAVSNGVPIREAIRRSDVTEAIRELGASLGGRVGQRGILTHIASRV